MPAGLRGIPASGKRRAIMSVEASPRRPPAGTAVLLGQATGAATTGSPAPPILIVDPLDRTDPAFAGLAAWLATHGDGLPTAVGSGKLAVTLRGLKAKYPDAAAAAQNAQGERGRPPSPRRWPASAVRDDSDHDATGAAEPTDPRGV